MNREERRKCEREYARKKRKATKEIEEAAYPIKQMIYKRLLEKLQALEEEEEEYEGT